MSVNWVEVAGIIATLIGGGTVGVTKLTRIAVAAETLAEDIKALAKQQGKTQAQVTDHENRLNRAQI